MNEVFDQILLEIKNNDIITIFSHVSPDYDAIGSSFGLKYWIQDNFPNKEVYVLAEKSLDLFEDIDYVDDSKIAKSLAFILDTPNFARIGNQKYALAKKFILIDHHPHVDIDTNPMISSTTYAATCEILGELFEYYNLNMTVRCAKSLYSGLLTDTLCFKTTNTTSHTLKVASYLTQFDFNISKLNQDLFDISLIDYRFRAYLCDNIVIADNFGYIILDKDTLNKLNINYKDAKNHVTAYGNIKEVGVWAIFAETDDGTYEGSLRSKKVTINDLAVKYHGGGHKNACGVNNLTCQELNSIIEELRAKSKEN